MILWRVRICVSYFEKWLPLWIGRLHYIGCDNKTTPSRWDKFCPIYLQICTDAQRKNPNVSGPIKEDTITIETDPIYWCWVYIAPSCLEYARIPPNLGVLCGAINHGLLVAGPLLEGLWGARWGNPLGRGPSDDIYGGWWLAGPRSPLRLLATKSLLRALHRKGKYKDMRGSQQQQEHGFQWKKAAYQWRESDPPLSKGMERSDASGMRAGLADLGCWWPLSAGKQVKAQVFQQLLRQNVDPESRGHILMENMSSGRFSTGAHCQTTQKFLAEFWTQADWPPYSPDLNTLDFSIWYVLQAEVQVTPYANLAALPGSFAMEWDHLWLPPAIWNSSLGTLKAIEDSPPAIASTGDSLSATTATRDHTHGYLQPQGLSTTITSDRRFTSGHHQPQWTHSWPSLATGPRSHQILNRGCIDQRPFWTGAALVRSVMNEGCIDQRLLCRELYCISQRLFWISAVFWSELL